MKIVESFARIALVTFLVLVWMLMSGLPKALADGKHKPAPKPQPPVVVAQGHESHTTEAFWAGAAGGGLAVTALQKTEHPWLYAVGAGIAAALVVNAASSSMDADETRAAVAGVIVGATGTGLVFGKKFFGWQKAIKF